MSKIFEQLFDRAGGVAYLAGKAYRELEEARRLAEEWRDFAVENADSHCRCLGSGITWPDKELPWEEK